MHAESRVARTRLLLTLKLVALCAATSAGFYLGRLALPTGATEPAAVSDAANRGPDQGDRNGSPAPLADENRKTAAVHDEASCVLEQATVRDGRTHREAPAIEQGGASAAADAETRSPVAVVKRYLAAQQWQDRLPFVLTPQAVGPLMALRYKDARLHPETFQDAQVLPEASAGTGTPDRVLITVDARHACPEWPYRRYVVVKTAEGYRVDWEASLELQASVRDQPARKALSLQNPIVEIRWLRHRQITGTPYARLEFEIANRSNRVLASWGLSADALDSRGKYLATGMAHGHDLGCNEAQTGELRFEVAGARIASWRARLSGLRIDLGDGESMIAIRQFTLRETKTITADGLDPQPPIRRPAAKASAEPKSESAGQGPGRVDSRPVAVLVQAGELLDDYDRNIAAADKLYKGKEFWIIGACRNPVMTAEGRLGLDLFRADRYRDTLVRCVFDKPMPNYITVMRFKLLNKAIVVGVVKGKKFVDIEVQAKQILSEQEFQAIRDEDVRFVTLKAK